MSSFGHAGYGSEILNETIDLSNAGETTANLRISAELYINDINSTIFRAIPGTRITLEPLNDNVQIGTFRHKSLNELDIRVEANSRHWYFHQLQAVLVANLPPSVMQMRAYLSFKQS